MYTFLLVPIPKVAAICELPLAVAGHRQLTGLTQSSGGLGCVA